MPADASTFQPQTNDQRPGNTGRKLVLLVASTMTVMAGATISPSLPGMKRIFVDTPDVLVELVLTIPALAIAVSAPLTGVVLDRLGRRRVLLWGLVVYAIAGSAGLVVPEQIVALLAARAVLGVAVAGIMSASITLIADYFRGQERAMLLGWQAAFMGMGGIVYLISGGALAGLHWRGPFAVYLAALLLVPFAAVYISEPQRFNGGPRVGGAAPGTPGGSVVLLYALAFVGMLLFYLIPVKVPEYLDSLLEGNRPLRVGLALAAMSVCGATASSLYRRVVNLVGIRMVFGLLFGFVGAGHLVLAQASSYGTVIVGVILVGLGIGMLLPNLNFWLTAIAPPRMRGRLVSGLTASFFLGQFVSPFAAQMLSQDDGIARVFSAGGTLSLALATAFLAAGWLGRRSEAELEQQAELEP